MRSDYNGGAAIFEIWVAFFVYADADARGSIKGRMN
jgi:hypothetical protein